VGEETRLLGSDKRKERYHLLPGTTATTSFKLKGRTQLSLKARNPYLTLEALHPTSPTGQRQKKKRNHPSLLGKNQGTFQTYRRQTGETYKKRGGKRDRSLQKKVSPGPLPPQKCPNKPTKTRKAYDRLEEGEKRSPNKTLPKKNKAPKRGWSHFHRQERGQKKRLSTKMQEGGKRQKLARSHPPCTNTKPAAGGLTTGPRKEVNKRTYE